MSNGLTYVYDEGVGGPALQGINANGSCTGTTASTAVAVNLPAFSIAAPAPFVRYTVTGDQITVRHDGTGSLTLGAQTLPLTVVGDVDCSPTFGTPPTR